jgi:hypothetical protein
MADFDETQDFESGFGNWVDTGGDCYWQRLAGATPSNNTGANNDHTYGDTSHYKIYVECSSNVCQQTDTEAIIEHDIDGASYALYLTLWYHMYGSSMGALHVDIYDGTWHNDLWSISGQQHTSSTQAYTQTSAIDLSAYTTATKVRVRYDQVTGWAADACVDDIRIYGDFRPSYTISGVTKDKNGSILGSCEVALFKADTATPPSYEFKAKTTSDAVTGAYSFNVYDQDAQYMVYSIKDDTPHVFDATDNVLQGV